MHRRSALGLLLALASVAGQDVQSNNLKAALHTVAQEKRARNQGSVLPSQDKTRCCTVAMFLGTMELPSDGETLQLGDQALACCREQLCPKFQTEKDCAWIASGDLSWKEKLSDDLDRVQTIDRRLAVMGGDDMDDPAVAEEKNILTGERARIESNEMARLAKVAPLTAMCDKVLDSDVPSEDIEEEQEARIQCISSFVDIAYGACAWKPDLSTCDALTAPKSGSGGVGTTLSLVIGAILGVTYYAAMPAASEGDSLRGEYESLEQLPGGGSKA